jgi:pimeloyl-ACP methyl ester carboxylesterase
VTNVGKKIVLPKKILIIIQILPAIAQITICIISAYVGWNLSHPKRSTVTDISDMKVPDYEDVTFKDINKALTLKGSFFYSPESNKTIIMAHGYTSSRFPFGKKTVNLIESLVNSGFNVLTFDFRNSGLSEGNITSVGLYEKDDLLGAIQFAKEKKPGQIVLLGFSMGASTSIMAAAQNKDVAAVIADSPFADLTNYLDENLSVWSKLPSIPFNKPTLISMRLLTGIDTSKVKPIEKIKEISPRPILLIHSKDDKSIPIENSYSLQKAAGENAQLWETEGVGHIKSYEGYPEEYVENVIRFLEALKES